MTEAKRPSTEPPSERALLRSIGMSRAKAWRAKQVAAIPEEEFERLIESDDPPTVTQLVSLARGPAGEEDRYATLLRAFNRCSTEEQARFIALIQDPR